MARLRILIDVDTDPTLEDPHEVAEDLLFDPVLDNAGLRRYAECETRFVGAEWEA